MQLQFLTVIPSGSESAIGIATRYDLNGPGIESADPSDRAVYDEGLRPTTCWDYGFESRRGRRCLFCVF